MKNDGGPAFPHPDYLAAGWSGMTLRDYFAAHAPPPPDWWMSYMKTMKSLGEIAGHLAQWRYEYADAMLKAKES